MLAWLNSYNEVTSFYGAKTDSITYIYSDIKIACSNSPLHFSKEVWAVAGTFTPHNNAFILNVNSFNRNRVHTLMSCF